jgi:membrane fusion protein (multidrug efflux system)
MNDQSGAPVQQDTAPRSSEATRRRANRARLVLLLIFLTGAAIGVGYWYLTRNQVSTDDAYTDGRAVTVAPQVSGTVVKLDVADNQKVKAGDVLVEIDPRAFQAARDQAAANLGVAEAQLADARMTLDWTRAVYPARLEAAQAQLASARATQFRTAADAKRQHDLPRQATTQQAIDTAEAALREANAQVAQAEARVREAQQISQVIGEAEAKVRQLEAQVNLARAQVDQAELNLGWTRITAPQDGWVTRRAVEKGNYVTAGQAIMSIVTPDVWITANFKEDQLAHMRPGQKVDISVDAYPDLHLKGHVDSIQFGTGSRFSAFPAENATGNFVKIVQRVPVKIIIDSGMDRPLPLGLSVQPVVHVKR